MDLEKLGILLGHRKRILKAIATLNFPIAVAVSPFATVPARAGGAEQTAGHSHVLRFGRLHSTFGPSRSGGATRGSWCLQHLRGGQSDSSTAGLTGIWAMACKSVSAIRMPMRTMPSERSAPAYCCVEKSVNCGSALVSLRSGWELPIRTGRRRRSNRHGRRAGTRRCGRDTKSRIPLASIGLP